MDQSKKLTPWTQSDKDQWLNEQKVKRSYQEDVANEIAALGLEFDVLPYGNLSTSGHALYLVKSKNFEAKKKTVLITGGVHGYETSGVQGALSFMINQAKAYESDFNFICAPCISPWAYETVNRWNANAIDPNRSFTSASQVEECALLLTALKPFLAQIHMHIDLHETTDTDNTVFRPALEKRDGKFQELSEIPDGFYTVGDTENPQLEFQKAIIDSVRKVTHIAAPDKDGKIIGEQIKAEGVILYPLKKLNLCAGITSAKYTSTTEVYPDSAKVTDAICIEAQIAAIKGGLDFSRDLG